MTQMKSQNGWATTLADPLRQGCRRGAYRERIYGVSAVLLNVPFVWIRVDDLLFPTVSNRYLPTEKWDLC